MARARDRAPSQHAYRGAVGATRTAPFHVTLPSGELVVTKVFVAVDVIADPELGQRLLADDATRGLNVVTGDGGQPIPLAVPVVYHDPAAEIFAVVASPGDRHRELELRAKLLADLAADTSNPVPAYVRDAAVVFGAAGLRAHLERLAERSLAEQRAADSGRELERERAAGERRKGELAAREIEVERRTAAAADRLREVERRASELERRASELDEHAASLARRLGEVEGREAELVRRQQEIEAASAELGRRWQELEVLRAELVVHTDALEKARTTPVRVIRSSEPPPPERMARATEPPPRAARATAAPRAVEIQAEPTTVAPALDDLAPPESETTNPYALLEDAAPAPPREPAPLREPLPATADPLTTATFDLPLEVGAPPRARPGEPGHRLAVQDGLPRLWLRVSPTSAEALAHGALDLRVQLHRQPEHAVVAVIVGTPHGVRGLSADRAVAFLDPTADLDRRWLTRLEQEVTLDVELATTDRRVRRVRLEAPLADNLRFLTRAAGDHQRGLAGGAAAFAEAVATLAAADHDLLGLHHPEHGELRIDKLEALATANQVRRALAIARRFSRPVREDYLVTVRGFPLARWAALRRAVLSRAIACGLWMGPDLAQVAIAAGLAASPAELWARLDAGFSQLLADAAANDLDPDAIEDNRAALNQEAVALGLTSGAAAAVTAGEVFASGTIAPKPARSPLGDIPQADLIALLDDRQRRLDAAVELCARRDPAAIRPVMAAVRRMSRAEAVRVLGSMVKFGGAAAATLTAGLASSKAFLRHGCALALAHLRNDEGTEAVIDVLLSEPTEIWREIARAVGQVGPPALMPLAARVGRMGDRASASARERMAWAMAHVAVRGGKTAIETLAGGSSVVAPVARMALERMAAAADDDLALREGPARDVTVNRAFSRRFFEVAGAPGEGGSDVSGPHELIGDEDLLIDVDDDVAEAADELDESDLIEG